jgi:chaperone modulatory protein CbpM
MIMRTEEFIAESGVDASALDIWIAAGWLRPASGRGGHEFSEIDVARAQLISDLRGDLGVNDEAVPIVLDLIDQIHGLRRLIRLLRRSDPPL